MFGSWLVVDSDSRLVRETIKNICLANKFRISQRNNCLARSVYLAMLLFLLFLVVRIYLFIIYLVNY